MQYSCKWNAIENCLVKKRFFSTNEYNLILGSLQECSLMILTFIVLINVIWKFWKKNSQKVDETCVALNYANTKLGFTKWRLLGHIMFKKGIAPNLEKNVNIKITPFPFKLGMTLRLSLV